MSDGSNKNPREAALELLKSIREELDANKKFTPRETIAELGKSIREEIELAKAEFSKMRTLEVTDLKKNAGQATPTVVPAPAPAPLRSIFDILGGTAQKGEDFIDEKHSNDEDKRLTDGDGKGSVLPGDKKAKKIPAEGSGGHDEKGSGKVLSEKTKKDEMAAAPSAPEAPKPPQAPGAEPAMKSELLLQMEELEKAFTANRHTLHDDPEQTGDRAEVHEAKHGTYHLAPTGSKRNDAGRKYEAHYISAKHKYKHLGVHESRQRAVVEMLHHHDSVTGGDKKQNWAARLKLHGEPTHKPDTSKKVTNMYDIVEPKKSKAPSHPAPHAGSNTEVSKSENNVFDVLAKGSFLGGKDQVSQHMAAHAMAAAPKPAAPAAGTGALPKPPKMPTMEEHASRASMFNDFMPQASAGAKGPGFGKGEYEEHDCPYCGKPMAKCSCDKA